MPVTHLLELPYRYSDNIHVILKVVATYNRLYKLGNPQFKRSLGKAYHQYKLSSFIFQKLISNNMNSQVVREVHLLQSLMIRSLLGQLNTPLDSQDQRALEQIKELRKLAFDGGKGQSNHRGRYSEDYKSLGFKSYVDPSQDFQRSPSGKMALNLMSYFAIAHTEEYVKFVQDNSCCSEISECPFGSCSIGLVELICNVFLSKVDAQDGESFLPCYFSHEEFLGVS